MRPIPTSSNPDVAARDQARDMAVGSQSQVWRTYVALLEATSTNGMKAALFFTRGGQKAMAELGDLMQSDRPISELLTALEAWQTKNHNTLEAFAWSSDASSAWTKLVSVDAPFAAKMRGELDRVDAAFAKALNL